MRNTSHKRCYWVSFSLLAIWLLSNCGSGPEEPPQPVPDFNIAEDENEIKISTPTLEAVIKKKGYVSGVSRGSFLDKETGFRDVSFGLDIVDFLLEPGSDEAYRDQLHEDLRYEFNNLVHGNRPKRKVEGPQICTRAKELQPELVRGEDFLAVRMDFTYTLAAPGKIAGSQWQQTLVFPSGKSYFISSDRIVSANDSDCLILRIDMPGHVRHEQGDTFSEIYLSYFGRIPSTEFLSDFPPHERFNYRADQNPVPKRFIRAVKLRNPDTGEAGPWLAGMTLDPSVVYEAWCHQRGYVCMIHEFGGQPIKAGESFSAAFVVGYFDSVEEMNRVYDSYAGHTGLEVSEEGWRLIPE